MLLTPSQLRLISSTQKYLRLKQNNFEGKALFFLLDLGHDSAFETYNFPKDVIETNCTQI